MRKVLCILFVLLLMISICSCSDPSTKNVDTVSYFYVRNEIDYGAASPVLIEVKQKITSSENYEAVILEYLTGSTTNDYTSPFPKETTLLSLEIENNQVQIILSEQVASLTPFRQTVAFACLTKTITSLTGLQNVQITISNPQDDSYSTYYFYNDSFTYFDTFTINDLENA